MWINIKCQALFSLNNKRIQYNCDDGSFTMAESNSFLSPKEIITIAHENKYLGIF